MTQVVDLFKKEEKQEKKKPIEIIGYIKDLESGTSPKCTEDTSFLSGYDFVSPLILNGVLGLDYFYAWDSDCPNDGRICYGHLNDGVPE